MSTRCQVEVKASGLAWSAETVLLYHHCDGYPSYMLPVILRAYESGAKPRVLIRKSKTRPKGLTVNEAWKLERPGKSAAYLCASDVSGFECESGTQLHGDIEWFYSIECVNGKGGSCADVPKWIVSVYVPADNATLLNSFWDEPKRESLKLVASGDIRTLAKQAKTIEKHTG